MNKITFAASLSTALFLGGCASLGKEGRIGQNNGSDPCFIHLENLDRTAVYYKDQRMTDIAAGALLGGGAGALAGAAISGDATAMIIGGVTGAVAGGFAADAYWSNKLQKVSNSVDQARMGVESDLKQDIDRLSSLDNEVAVLVRCRTAQRDQIKKQYMEGKLTLQQAQEEWKKWGELLKKDREEIKYLNEALDNVRKIEQSYAYAANQVEAPANITEEMQRKWSQELQIEKDRELQAAETLYQEKLSVKKLKPKQKKSLKAERKQKIDEITKSYVAKEDSIKNKINPKGNPLKLMVSSVHEKHESIRKNQAQIETLALEASNDKGFEQIVSKIFQNNVSCV
jgi:hypothetical protein